MSDQFLPQPLVIQFAKAPVRGKVKTRLEPALGKEGCLRLHDKLLRHTFRALSGRQSWVYQLWVTPGNPGYFQNLVATGEGSCQQAVVHLQWGHDLGERMTHAVNDNIDHYEQVIVVGSDCPEINSAYVQAAIEKLRAGCQVVIAPARDGGYGLIGFSEFDSQVFDNIPWGSERVMDSTRTRLEALGLIWAELPLISDIDRPEDLPLLAGFSGFESFL